MKFTRPLMDFKNDKLCDPCWNGRHWHKALRMGKQGGLFDNQGGIIWDCIGPPCECLCREMYKQQTEKRKRVKPDFSQQLGIDMTNPIQIGQTKTHKDE